MPNFRDLTGQKFGKLTAIKRVENAGKATCWLFKCECGNRKRVLGINVTRGRIVSCGCFQSESRNQRNLLDIAGKKFGKLTAIKRASKAKDGHIRWLCVCECGNTTELVTNKLTAGHSKSCGCQRIKTGKAHHNWKGGKYKTSYGYVYGYAPENPNANKKGQVFEHRLVMESKIRRTLLPNENVHHKNGIRDDNRPENLELWVKVQPAGQRVEDLVEFSLQILRQYAPEKLK